MSRTDGHWTRPRGARTVRGMTDRGSFPVSNATDNGARAGIFATTRWTLVRSSRGDDAAGRAALETLCRTYWFPVYALVRRRGFDEETARDFTQEFFARMLSREGFAAAQRERGREKMATISRGRTPL